MYCPRCAKEFESGTSYCRTCGLSLEGVVEIVKGEADNEPDIRRGPNKKLQRLGFVVSILGLFIGLSISLFITVGLEPAAAVAKVMFVLLLMTGVSIIGAGFIFPQKRYIKKKQKGLPDQNVGDRLASGTIEQLPPADRNVDDALLPQTPREPDSITEHTTRQLR